MLIDNQVEILMVGVIPREYNLAASSDIENFESAERAPGGNSEFYSMESFYYFMNAFEVQSTSPGYPSLDAFSRLVPVHVWATI